MVVKIMVTEPRDEKWNCWSDKHALSWFFAGFMFNSLWSNNNLNLVFWWFYYSFIYIQKINCQVFSFYNYNSYILNSE